MGDILTCESLAVHLLGYRSSKTFVLFDEGAPVEQLVSANSSDQKESPYGQAISGGLVS